MLAEPVAEDTMEARNRGCFAALGVYAHGETGAQEDTVVGSGHWGAQIEVEGLV